MDDQTFLDMEQLDNDFTDNVEELLTEQAIEVFILWAKAFPHRYLSFDSGMGIASFKCPSIDDSALVIPCSSPPNA